MVLFATGAQPLRAAGAVGKEKYTPGKNEAGDF
jgi:hypothetical protein